MKQVVIGKQVESKDEFAIEVDALIEGGLLLTASSGNGKSHKLKKILQKTYGLCGQIVIDPEGDFNTMRTDNYDYILAGKDENADIKITHKGEFPSLLARKVLELNANIIIDLYELEPREQKEFTAKFVRALVDIPKSLWGKKYIVVIDEAHELCPEEKKKNESTEAKDAIIALAAKGRKRGIRLVAATQRLAKLAKNATSELKNQLVGGLNNSDDRKRACEEIGFDKSQADVFRTLDIGNFFAVGPAFGFKTAKLVRSGGLEDGVPAKTTEDNAKYIRPPTQKVKSVLIKLADLPQEAEKELKTKQDLEGEVARLKMELRKREVGAKQPVQVVRQSPSQEELQQIRNEGYNRGWSDCWADWNKSVGSFITDVQRIAGKIDQLVDIRNGLNKLQQAMREKLPVTSPRLPISRVIPPKPIIAKTNSPPRSTLNSFSKSEDLDVGKLKEGAMKMLKAAAMYHPATISKNQMATISGFSVNGGTFQTYLSQLKRADLISISGDDLSITDLGLSFAGTVDPLPTDPESLLNVWKPKFKQGAAKMLEAVFRAYPNEMTKEELGEETQFIPSGGTFQTYLSELRRNGLVEISGNSVRASKELFPQ